MLVYIPIACGLLGSVLAIATVIQPRAARGRAAAVLLAVAAAASWPAAATGRDARHALRADAQAYAALEPVLENHTAWAGRARLALAAAALLALAAVPRASLGGRAAVVVRALSATAALVGVGLLIVTGIHGSAVASARTQPARGTPSAPPLSGFDAAD